VRRGDREQGRDPERPEIAPFEHDGLCGDRARRREPNGRHGVGKLGRRIRWIGVGGVDLSDELEHAQAVDVPAEVRRP